MTCHFIYVLCVRGEALAVRNAPNPAQVLRA